MAKANQEVAKSTKILRGVAIAATVVFLITGFIAMGSSNESSNSSHSTTQSSPF